MKDFPVVHSSVICLFMQQQPHLWNVLPLTKRKHKAKTWNDSSSMWFSVCHNHILLYQGRLSVSQVGNCSKGCNTKQHYYNWVVLSKGLSKGTATSRIYTWCVKSCVYLMRYIQYGVSNPLELHSEGSDEPVEREAILPSVLLIKKKVSKMQLNSKAKRWS